MSHLDDESIALAAIGEALDGAQTAHLVVCEACRVEVESLARVVGLARSSADPATLAAPPDEVWAHIAAATGVDPRALPRSIAAQRAARAVPADASAYAEDRGATTGAAAAAGSGRRSPRTRLLVAASVAGLVIGVGGTLVWQTASEDDPAVVASANLAPLPDKIGSARAEVVQTSTGRALEMTLDMPLPSDAFLEVWLLSADGSRMLPVGVIASESDAWTLPPDITFTDYPLVDVSIEPYDGDPAHSTNSVIRGQLDVSPSAAIEASMRDRG